MASARSLRTGGGTESGSGGGVSRTCIIATLTGESATNGLRPETHSYPTTPSEYTSPAGVVSCPMACSGAMYWAVPTTIPAWVTAADPIDLAMPKSVSLTCPEGVMRMLPGLTSRCTNPIACAALSARPVCSSMSRVWRSGSDPSRDRTSDSGSPTTSSMTR